MTLVYQQPMIVAMIENAQNLTSFEHFARLVFKEGVLPSQIALPPDCHESAWLAAGSLGRGAC